MRISRVHLPERLVSGELVELAGESAHYLGRVLRLKPGDAVALFNSEDGEFAAQVVAIGRNRLSLRIQDPLPTPGNPRLAIHLGLGLSRGDRMDYAIQKATELGVGQITPLFTAFSEVRLDGERLENKSRHWTRIAISACEQCGRSQVPVIHEPASLADWLASHPGGLLLDPRGSARLGEGPGATPVNLLVGPEGGFSDAELALAQERGFVGLRLGPRILRTETAPVAALAVLQYVWGDLAD